MLLFAGSRDVFWMGDFYLEVYPAYERLMDGNVQGFLDHLPGYSGFTVAGRRRRRRSSPACSVESRRWSSG